MRMYDIIQKKKAGEALSDPEIAFFTEGYTKGEIPDYQASALLMAICLRGMKSKEAASLTHHMMMSGERIDLTAYPTSADKHSTGGVGDKTTLLVAPIAASLGCTVAKMSGRGLGHTGGTVDKLEAIPGYRTTLSPEEFFDTVKRTGLSVIGQSGNLAPADKKLYALRDVTATIESIPLIASSIMSKKLAAGAHSIVLDVKVGSGAFMKSLEDARALAEEMVGIGNACGRQVRAVLSNMQKPLGRAIGNALEVAEAAEILRENKPCDLLTLSLTLAAHMASLALSEEFSVSYARAEEAVSSGKAFLKMEEWIAAQGGDTRVLRDPSLFGKAGAECEITAESDGYFHAADAMTLGLASVLSGAGRTKKEDPVDPLAGILLLKEPGDEVKKGEPLARMYATNEETLALAEKAMAGAFSIGRERPEELPLLLGTVG